MPMYLYSICPKFDLLNIMHSQEFHLIFDVKVFAFEMENFGFLGNKPGQVFNFHKMFSKFLS